MIPGFAYMYKDKDDFIHLFFYPGIDNDNNRIYKDIDLPKHFDYDVKMFRDHSIDYRFLDKNIFKIICKFINRNNQEIIEDLKI